MRDWLDCCWVGAWVTWPVRADGMFDQHGSAQSTVRWVVCNCPEQTSGKGTQK